MAGEGPAVPLDDQGLDDLFVCEFPGHPGDRAVKRRDVKFRHPNRRCLCRPCFAGSSTVSDALLLALAEQVAEGADGRPEPEPEPEPPEGDGAVVMDAGRAVEFRWYCRSCVKPVLRPASRFRQHCPECDARLLSWREWMDGDEGGLS